ncbi:MAG: hypothetical protein A3I08_02365 [Candidatus Andersenbacteria bacterium RIFCSPLOWO2_02_FULL_46_11]|nr:MAG: hypothetical protein A3I08_02365 [Candidatus Andersenbacteria bacterium RIFCSPLOWO2_02_FULL_46_11]
MKKHIVSLTSKERSFLQRLITSGAHKAREITRARILLASDEGNTDQAIVGRLSCSLSQVRSVRRRFDERRGIAAVITDAPRPGQPVKLTPQHEAFIIATACTPAPPNHAHWTAGALKDQLLATYQELRPLSNETVRRLLAAHQLKPWREKNVVHSKGQPALSRANG